METADRAGSGSGRGERLGVLGGTFDPPHVGHAIVARDVVEGLELDRLLVVPAPDPPHRSFVLPARTRLALVRRLFEDCLPIEVSDLEFRREGPSYSVRTLETLRERHPGAELVLVIGADQFAVLDTWHEHERLPDLARIAVMRREGETPAPPDGMDPIDYIAVHVTRIDLSASRIRERLRAGKSIRFLVPESIRPDIERAWRDRAVNEPASRGC